MFTSHEKRKDEGFVGELSVKEMKQQNRRLQGEMVFPTLLLSFGLKFNIK